MLLLLTHFGQIDLLCISLYRNDILLVGIVLDTWNLSLIFQKYYILLIFGGNLLLSYALQISLFKPVVHSVMDIFMYQVSNYVYYNNI